MSSAAIPLAAQFANLWKLDKDLPDVFAFLQEHSQASPRETADVLLVDQRLRWKRSVGISVEEYLRRCPQLAGQEALRLELITEEFAYREQAGEAVELDEFLARFPELGELGFLEVSHHASQPDIASPTDLICQLFGESDVVPVLRDELSESLVARVKAIKNERPQAPRLQSCDVFAALPTKVVRRIEDQMTAVQFPAGEVLIRQGTPGTSLLVITAGVVDIISQDQRGQRHLVGRAGRGHVLGEMSLLSDQPRTADAVAHSDVAALELPAAIFHQLAAQHPRLCVVLTNLVANRLGGRGRDVLADKLLGGYRILRRLGRGGMAVVYKAVDVESGKVVALKMMSHRLVYDAESAKRFQREADIVQALDHPGICRVQGRFGAFHTFFIVMEYCDGLPLDELLQRRGQLPPGETRKILGQLAAALHHAHQAGIAHRDIKPSNVMILRDGSVKLMDFGLATLFGGGGEEEESLAGTPRYMAPEQFRGGPAGVRGDYFSLGALAYELVTSRPLFATNDLAELFNLHGAWQPPSFAAVCPQAEVAIREAFAHALDKEVTTRELDLAAIASWAAPLDTAGLGMPAI